MLIPGFKIQAIWPLDIERHNEVMLFLAFSVRFPCRALASSRVKSTIEDRYKYRLLGTLMTNVIIAGNWKTSTSKMIA